MNVRRLPIGIAAVVAAAGLAAVWSLFAPPAEELPVTPVEVEQAPAGPTDRRTVSERVASPIHWVQMPGEKTGVVFRYFGGPNGEHQMFEQNGGGIAIFDFDRDGWSDLCFSNGDELARKAQSLGHSQKLFRSVGEFHFEDVTTASGLTAFGFGQGCAAGDFDNDGFTDLFVAAWGRSRLWQNNGDGSFTEVTPEAGVRGDDWSTSAAFADLDGDGQLDLYVVNYLNWVPDRQKRTRIPSPMDYPGQPDRLYHNAGDGRFEEVGAATGIAIPGEGKGLALEIADLNDDGRLDVYVANDTTRNFLFLNQGGGLFDEAGVPTGLAVSQDGAIGSSMGVAIADYNRDTYPDVFVTNFAHELLDIFAGLDGGGFVATNTELGVDAVSRPALNFGIVVADFDLDQWPDLFFANGHLWDETASGGQYRMRQTIMRNQSGQRFVDVSDQAGPYFQQEWLARCAAVGDLDNDGDLDLVIGNLEDESVLLRNDSDRAGDSLRVEFAGRTSSRQPLGCRVDVTFDDGERLMTRVPAGGSFQATHDSRVLIPLASGQSIESIRLTWPDQTREIWRNVERARETVRLIEGTGERSSD